jgi:hypothetical protein
MTGIAGEEIAACFHTAILCTFRGLTFGTDCGKNISAITAGTSGETIMAY